MTEQEMNDYLKSIGGLRNAWGVYERTIDNCKFFSVNSGWYPIIKDLINDLIGMGWDKNLIQCKEKFGGLRFYIDEGSDEIHKRIMDAEINSYRTCETCGKEGEIRRDIGWHLTLCDEHYKLKNKIEKV